MRDGGMSSLLLDHPLRITPLSSVSSKSFPVSLWNCTYFSGGMGNYDFRLITLISASALGLVALTPLGDTIGWECLQRTRLSPVLICTSLAGRTSVVAARSVVASLMLDVAACWRLTGEVCGMLLPLQFYHIHTDGYSRTRTPLLVSLSLSVRSSVVFWISVREPYATGWRTCMRTLPRSVDDESTESVRGNVGS